MMEGPGGRFSARGCCWALLTGKEATTVPVPVFLIRHPSAGAILVDTGLHPSIATDAEENFGRLLTRLLNPRSTPTATPRRSSANAGSSRARSRSW